jgi:hypothetical protein
MQRGDENREQEAVKRKPARTRREGASDEAPFSFVGIEFALSGFQNVYLPIPPAAPHRKTVLIPKLQYFFSFFHFSSGDGRFPKKNDP